MTVKTYYKRASANDFHTVLRLIDNGKWLNERPYHVIHRVAGLPHHHGGMNDLTDWCFSKESNILIDTLSDNTVMHRLTKTAELNCGLIHLQNGDQRQAYQKSEVV